VDYYELAKAIFRRSEQMIERAMNQVEYNSHAALGDAAVAKALKIIAKELLEQAKKQKA
jgi:hypothetical protein